MSNKCVRLRIEGRVQGVWYRGWTQQQAQALNLDGWIRNKNDGSVEGVFSGPVDAVDHLISQCWSGPPLAQVSAIYEAPETELPDSGFSPDHRHKSCRPWGNGISTTEVMPGDSALIPCDPL